MRIFVTGAPGFIGSALVPELIQAGHQVLGLTRSEAGAEAGLDGCIQPHEDYADHKVEDDGRRYFEGPLEIGHSSGSVKRIV